MTATASTLSHSGADAVIVSLKVVAVDATVLLNDCSAVMHWPCTAAGVWTIVTLLPWICAAPADVGDSNIAVPAMTITAPMVKPQARAFGPWRRLRTDCFMGSTPRGQWGRNVTGLPAVYPISRRFHT